MGNLGRPGYGATTNGMWPYRLIYCPYLSIHLALSVFILLAMILVIWEHFQIKPIQQKMDHLRLCIRTKVELYTTLNSVGYLGREHRMFLCRNIF